MRAIGTDGTARDVFTTVGSGGSLGCNPLRAWLGLGSAVRVEFVLVRWPASGEVQRLTDVPLDTALVVTQGDASPARRERQPLRTCAEISE